MTIEFDDNGKFYTDIIDKRRVRVMINISGKRIIGNIHVAKEKRLKDELDLVERFIAVTDASICTQDGCVEYTVPFIAVQRNEMVWVIPVNEADVCEEGEEK
jgi:hypothetical protein